MADSDYAGVGVLGSRRSIHDSQFIADWSTAFPRLQVDGDRDVVPLIERHASGFVDPYTVIRFPTAKSDVARALERDAESLPGPKLFLSRSKHRGSFRTL